jgi:ubiquinone biosynthesis protein UbiJ
MVSRLGKLVNVTVKVPEELREQMRKVKTDWGEYLRETIRAKVREEMAKEAAERLEAIRRRVKAVPTEVLVAWLREEREGR